jgi:putative membrane-bound dehydrogenase-like protein
LVLIARATVAAETDDILRTFQIHPDFQIELVAIEPLVLDPVDLEFDEFGRAFVIEMPGYPFPKEPGRLVLLEDADGDGVFDTRTIYAEGFPIASSILPYRGGVLVASPPDLVFVRDTDGDNRADVQEVLLTGFAAENTQHNFAGLNHGIDNWVYAGNGGNGGEVYWPQDPQTKFPIQRSDFRIDLENRRFELYGPSTGGFETTFDDWGRFFGVHNMRPFVQTIFPSRYVADLPLPGIDLLKELPDYAENGMVRIYGIGTPETRVNHPEQSGYFSGACGITYYGGGAFPPEFRGNLFTCDVVMNLVHRAVLTEDGAGYRASRADHRSEFLASTDRGFRPVNLTVGPDGALYLLDMHRTVIEHPEWIPDEIEKDLDLYAGSTEGRIFRITPKGGLPWSKPHFPRNDVSAVAAHLLHPNKWWRDTAQRLLVEWQDQAAVPPLLETLANAPDPRARLHALWTLEGLDALDDETIQRTLDDPHPAVREHAVLLAEDRLSNANLIAAVASQTDQDAPRVRMQAVLTLSAAPEVPGTTLEAAVGNASRMGLGDTHLRTALLVGAHKSPLPHFVGLLRESSMATKEGAAEYLQSLGILVAHRASAGDLDAALSALAKFGVARQPLLAAGLVGLADGLGSARVTAQGLSDQAAQVLTAFVDSDIASVRHPAWRIGRELKVPPTSKQVQQLEEAGTIALDNLASTALRVDALSLLEFAPFADRQDVLFALLSIEQPRELRRAAMAQLAKSADPRVAERLISMWKTLSPEEMRAASDVLLYQRANHDLLLTALEDGRIALAQMNFHLERRRRLLRSEDATVRARAEALFSDAGVVTRASAIEAMRPALTLQGDPAHGREVFQELCAQCHRVADEGFTLAPNLTDASRKSPEQLLFDILDPNAAVDSEFIGFVVETHDGGIYSGMLSAETDSTVTLRQANDIETVFGRDQIRRMYSSGMSLMPEALEADMPHQKMADLLAFLQQQR